MARVKAIAGSAGAGAFIVLVGPDGVGKSTLASALLRLSKRQNVYFHFRPPMFQQWGSGPDPGVVVDRELHDASPRRSLGWVRIIVQLARFWVGYLTSVRPAIRKGALVVCDRWAYGYVAAPSPLRYYGPPQLATTVMKLMPAPDLVVCLVAPAEEIRKRKPELDLEEIRRQLDAWRAVPARRLLEFDALQPPEEMAAKVLSCLDD